MLRKALALGMAFILVISLLLVSMITCFTYKADAHWRECKWNCTVVGLTCIPVKQCVKLGEHVHTGG